MLLLECARAGLLAGKLRGPSMLRDIMLMCLLLLAYILLLEPFDRLLLYEDVTVEASSASMVCPVVQVPDRVAMMWLVPGVLVLDLWCLGDDGALPTVLRVCNGSFISNLF